MIVISMYYFIPSSQAYNSYCCYSEKRKQSHTTKQDKNLRVQSLTSFLYPDIFKKKEQSKTRLVINGISDFRHYISKENFLKRLMLSFPSQLFSYNLCYLLIGYILTLVIVSHSLGFSGVFFLLFKSYFAGLEQQHSC